MTTSRIDKVTKALQMGITGDVSDIGDVFTEDVVGWGPNLFVTSREELAEAFGERQDAFTDIVFDITAADTVGQKVIAEWSVTAVHSGPIVLDEEFRIEATGRQLLLAGATFAEFDGEKISRFRSYFDDAALLEQMLEPI